MLASRFASRSPVLRSDFPHFFSFPMLLCGSQPTTPHDFHAKLDLGFFAGVGDSPFKR